MKNGYDNKEREDPTENPDRIAMVVITADAPDSNGVVSAKVVIPNPEVKGEYKFNIIKVDENNEPVSDVTFKVNNVLTEETDENGMVNVIDKELLETGTDEYVISEFKASKGLRIPA